MEEDQAKSEVGTTVQKTPSDSEGVEKRALVTDIILTYSNKSMTLHIYPETKE